MSKIATSAEVNIKTGSTLSPDNLCPTYSDIINTGKSIVSGSYSDSQLTRLEDISKKGSYNLGIQVASTANIRAISYNFLMDSGERFNGTTSLNQYAWLSDINYQERCYPIGSADSVKVLECSIDGVASPTLLAYILSFVFTNYYVRSC